jgi:YebC/PmpR family DNA-binding regulatory protein
MSGHSKWSTIKRQKGVADARRGQLFTKLTKEIIIAAREGGGDPGGNFRLRLAVQKARDSNMPMDNVERAIKKGTGELEGASLIDLVLEGYGPGGVAIMVQGLSDNRNRTIQEIRHAFTKYGGNMGESGCVAWMFKSRGVVTARIGDMDADEVGLMAIDAGADDVKTEGEYLEIYTAPDTLETVSEALKENNVEVESAEVSTLPDNTIELEEKTALQVLKLLEKLEELDDVQSVSSNADFSDEILEKHGEQ